MGQARIGINLLFIYLLQLAEVTGLLCPAMDTSQNVTGLEKHTGAISSLAQVWGDWGKFKQLQDNGRHPCLELQLHHPLQSKWPGKYLRVSDQAKASARQMMQIYVQDR